MKTVNLFKKEVEFGGRMVLLNSLELFTIAVENAECNLKGIGRVAKALAILERLRAVNGQDKITLDDADFEILYQSVDATRWTPAAMKFPEFFTEIQEAKTRKA
jgi:hypothetical protein